MSYSTEPERAGTLLPNQPVTSASDESPAPSPETPATRIGDTVSAGMWGWLLPRRAARRTWNGALWQAWLWHAAVSLLTFFVAATIFCWYEDDYPLAFLNKMMAGFQQDPREFLIDAAITIGVFELVVVLVAFAVMPWGCQDEPIGRSFANTFRQTWLHTTHLLAVLPLLMLILIGFEEWGNSYRQAHGYNRWGLSPAERLEYEQLKPLLLRYAFPFSASLVGLSGVWIIWSLVRAVATPRPEPTFRRDPMCEFCGYNLIATPMDSRCPECGRAVVDSLGEHVRDGPPWGQGRFLGSLRHWGRNCLLAVLRPGQFGRMIPARTPLFGHGRVFALHMTTAYVVGVASVGIVRYLEGQRLMRHDRDYYSFFTPIDEFGQVLLVCAFFLLILLAFLGLWAWLVTVTGRAYTGRNLGRVAMVMTAYATSLPVLWLFCLFTGYAIVHGGELQNRIHRRLRNPYVDPELIVGAMWIIPTLIVVAWYCHSISRGVRAARWANR